MKQRLGALTLMAAPAAAVMLSFFAPNYALADITVDHLRQWNDWSSTVKPQGYRLDIDRSAGTADHPAAKIEAKLPEQKGAFSSIFVDFSPELYKGKKLEYSAWIRTEKVTGAASLWATADNEGEVLSFDDMANRAVSGTSDWRKFFIVLSIPPESKRLRAGFLLKGGGTAWIRDPAVRIASADSKTTMRRFDAGKFGLYTPDSHPRNLLFDDHSITNANPEGVIPQWGVHTDDKEYTVILDEKTQRGGKPCVLIDCVVPEPKSFVSIHQIFSAKNYRQKRLRFSGDLKTEKVTDWTALFMQVDAPDRIVGFDAMEERPVKGTTDWSRYDVVLDVPPQSRKIKIGFLQAGTGRCWLSNCALEVVNSDVPTTGKPVMDDRLPKGKLPAKPEFSFE